MTKNYSFWLRTTSCLTLALTASPSLAEPTQLPTVQVEADRESEDYNATEAPASLVKYTSPLRDTPQTINTVTKQLIEDRNASTLRDVLRNAPGISLAAGEAGAQGDSFTIRGFSGRNDIFLDGMRDFGSYYRDPFNYSEVEVLKGPASIMFGRGSTGGIVNQESKLPELRDFNQNTITFGTDATKRITADVNKNLGGNTAFRLNVMANDSGFADRDAVENKRYGIAPSLAFGIGTDTRFDVSYFHQTEDNVPDYGIPFLFSHPAPVSRDNYYGFTDGNNFLKTSVNIGTAKYEHDFNDNLTIRNQLRYGHYNRDVQITEPQISGGVALGTPPSAITVTRAQIAVHSNETFLSNQTDLKAKFNILGFENETVSGVELARETSEPSRFRYTGVPGTNLADPSNSGNFSGVKSIQTRGDGTAESIAFYGVDTIKLNNYFDLIGGIRHDWVKSNFNQPVSPAVEFDRIDRLTSYRGGVVFKPADNGSVYFSYGTSFNPSIESLSLSAANANTKPEETETYEVGTKWDLLDKKLSTNFAVFYTVKTNARTPDPNNALLNVVTGEQEVNGFEIGLSGKITDKWQVNSGYAMLQSDVTKSNTLNEKGHELGNVPRHTFNLFSTYNLTDDIQIGGGANAVSKRKGRTTPDAATGIVSEVPGYVTFDAMAKYNITKSASIQLNIINVGDKYYYDQVHPAHIVPGAGRTALISTTFSF